MLRIVLIGLLLIFIARAFWRVIDGIIEGTTGKRKGEIKSGMKLMRDPVCGTHVVAGASLSFTTSGSTYYFCSEKCRNEYQNGFGQQ